MAMVPKKRREDWDPLMHLQEMHEAMHKGGRLDMFWGPSVEVQDARDKLMVKAEIPGMSMEDINVSVMGDTLVIRGEKKQEKEFKEKDIVRSERYYGSFERDILLPSSVNADKASASYKNGVLELVLPKKEEARGKQIKLSVKK